MTLCFLNDTRFLNSFEYFGKIASQERYRLIAFIFVNMIQHPGILKNNINHLSKRGPPPFFHSDTNLVRGNVLVHSVEKKTRVLVVTGELIWLLILNILSFNYIQTTNKSQFQKIQKKLYVHLSVIVLTNHYECRLLFLLDAHY